MRVALTFTFTISLLSSLAQEKKLETEIDLIMYASRPGENRSVQHDPSLQLSASYYVHRRIAAGLGTGLLSPYYTTTLAPVFIQAHGILLPKAQIFLKGRVGQFIPLSPEDFKGGLFAELALGKDFNTGGKSKFRMMAGYSHQEMTSINEDIWWANDLKAHYEYSRILISLGWVF